MRVRAEVSGSKELLQDLQRMGKLGAEVGMAILDAKAKQIAARAKVLVPVDDVEGGDLRDSIRTSKPQRTRAGRVSVGIVAGGTSLARLASERGRKDPGAYAIIQHEDVTLQHPGGGQSKFIETPFLEVSPSVPDTLREAIDRG